MIDRFLKSLPVFLLWAGGLCLCGCVNSMARSSWEQLTVVSDPPGAQVRLSNGVTGTTPVHFGIRRGGDLKITISKEGFQTVVVSVTSKIDATGAMNALPVITDPISTGLLFSVTELASSSATSHQPNPVMVKLKPLITEGHESTNPVGGKIRFDQ